MKTLICTLVALLTLAGCASRGSSQAGETPPAQTEEVAAEASAPEPVVSCVPVKKAVAATPATQSSAKTKKKTSRSKRKTTKAPSTSTESAKPAAPSGPVSPNSDGSCPAGYDRVVTQAAPVAAKPAAEPTKAAPEADPKDAQSRTVKSKDGSFEGEIFGKPAPGSKLARVQIGMTEEEVRQIMGAPSNHRRYITAKAFIPFYFGSDSSRIEWVYRGYGSVAFDASHWGGGGVVMMINHDPKIE